MNEYIQTNKRALLLLTGLFFILALVLYFMLVRPTGHQLLTKKETIKEAHQTIDQLNRDVKLLEMNLEEISDVEQLINENKIPTKKSLDEYILSLQQLELITNSHIEQIDFVYDHQFDDHPSQSRDEAVDEHGENTETTANDHDLNNDTKTKSENEEGSQLNSSQKTEEKPDNLEMISVSINGYSSSPDELITLLEAIEQDERLSIVSFLTVEQPTEYDLEIAEEANTNISFEIELTTFYYEK